MNTPQGMNSINIQELCLKDSKFNLEKFKEIILPYLKNWQIEKAILFGSFARNNFSKKSDLDIVLIMKTDLNFFDRYDLILKDIYQVIRGADIELLIYTPEEFENIKHRKFIQNILNEGIVFFESR